MTKIPSSKFSKKSAKIPTRKLAKSKKSIPSMTIAKQSAKSPSPPATPPIPAEAETRQERLSALKRQSRSLISASDLESPSAELSPDHVKTSDVTSEDVRSDLPSGRIEIIPPIHGKLTYDGKVCEPDIYWIMEKWLARHPEIDSGTQDVRVTGGQWTTEDGLSTEVIHATIKNCDDLAGYELCQDTDLYEYWLAEDRYHEAG